MRSDGQSVAPAALVGSKASRRWLRHKLRDPNKEAGVESPASVLWATGRCKGTRCGTLCRGQRWCQGCVGTTGARRQPGTEGCPLLPPHPHQCNQTGHSQSAKKPGPSWKPTGQKTLIHLPPGNHKNGCCITPGLASWAEVLFWKPWCRCIPGKGCCSH